jgi:hypothetical protein
VQRDSEHQKGACSELLKTPFAWCIQQPVSRLESRDINL